MKGLKMLAHKKKGKSFENYKYKHFMLYTPGRTLAYPATMRTQYSHNIRRIYLMKLEFLQFLN